MDHRRRLLERLLDLPLLEPPAPWRRIAVHAVGGLTEIGFGEGTDLLLAVSHNGRSVFDCRSGGRVAEGIGPLAGTTVRLAGLHGGGLPLVTADSWSWRVQLAYPAWPDAIVVLEPPARSVFVEHLAGGCVKVAEVDVPRACGFSGTGRTLVIASSHTLEIVGRD